MLLLQAARLARSFALARAGKSIAARMAMIAMTTKSSISVKARQLFRARVLRGKIGLECGSTTAGLSDCNAIGATEKRCVLP